MATAKNKKAAANKKSPAKPAAKKAKPVKAVAKKSAKVAPKKAVKATTASRKVVKPAKPAASAKSVAKPSPKKVVKSQVSKTATKPSAAKSVPSKVAAAKKKEAPKPAAKVAEVKKTSPSKKESVVKVAAVKSDKTEKKSAFVAKPVTAKKTAETKTAPSKTEKPAKGSKKKKEDDEDGEEGPDPLHLKADKVIKELEEIMDLSKMRPRIQAGSTPKTVIVKPAHPPLKLVEPTNTTKEKFQLEFEFRSSPKILFTSLSDSSGLAGWFADEVKTKDDLYTFIWEGGESYARLVAIRDLQLVRFQWLDDTDGTYFQFEIKEDDITSDIALVITDFANPGEKDSSIKLWESQVQNLRMLLGSL